VKVKISNETLESLDTNRIWDRFSKGDASRGKDVESFGLGLSIVQDILKLHDQAAQVSIEDGWVTFEFQLKK
jgi:signal transduction histidine kinase